MQFLLLVLGSWTILNVLPWPLQRDQIPIRQNSFIITCFEAFDILCQGKHVRILA